MPDTHKHIDRYPPIILLAVLFLFMVFASFIGQSLLFFLTDKAGFDVESLLSGQISALPFGKRNLLRTFVLINHLFTFFIPAVLVARMLQKKKCWRFLCLNELPTATALGGSALWILMAFPLVQYIYWLNQQIPLPAWAIDIEKSTSRLVEMLLVMDSPVEMWFSLLVMAFIPALGEELFFRGIIQQTTERFFKKPVMAVWLTALIFSLFHFQFQGLIPRFLLGAMLGFLFYWSRNLWLSIAAHFFNNGIQVIGAYYWKDQLFASQESSQEQAVSWWLALFSLGFVLIGGSKLKAYLQSLRTES